jgi:ribonuclease T2
LNRQYDPVPAPNTTNGLRNGTAVPAYKSNTTVADFLTTLGKLDLLAYMKKYWINQGAPSTDLWAHEFSKHATCFSTFETACYGPSYVQHQEVAEFYATAIKYYQRLPTWLWLSNAGIKPSNTTTYTLSDIQSALVKGYGALPYTGCFGPAYNTTAAGNGTKDNGKIYFDEVWYYFYVSLLGISVKANQLKAYGRPQDGNWAPQNASVSNSANSSCATSKGAIHYLERTASSIQ